MSDAVQPHRRQPTRLLHPWDSPGKNAGVGCHFLLQCMHAKLLQSRPTLAITKSSARRVLAVASEQVRIPSEVSNDDKTRYTPSVKFES